MIDLRLACWISECLAHMILPPESIDIAGSSLPSCSRIKNRERINLFRQCFAERAKDSGCRVHGRGIRDGCAALLREEFTEGKSKWLCMSAYGRVHRMEARRLHLFALSKLHRWEVKMGKAFLLDTEFTEGMSDSCACLLMAELTGWKWERLRLSAWVQSSCKGNSGWLCLSP